MPFNSASDAFQLHPRRSLVWNDPQTNKASLCEQIADLVNSRQLDSVVDVRDESDRDGMRVVVEIRRSGDPNFVREQLYTRTRLQVRVSVNLVGLIGREPKVLTLSLIHI